MLRHAARAVPWPLLAVTAVLLALMLRIVEQWPYTMWPLQGIAVGLLAGVASFAYDEPSAAVVDTLPRGLGWRTAARSIGVATLVCWWLVLVTLTSDAYFGHPSDVASQGMVATLAVVAATVHLRRHGRSRPATGLASVVVSVAAYLSLARPAAEHFPVFPYTSDGPWSGSQDLWTAVLVGAVAWLVVSLRR